MRNFFIVVFLGLFSTLQSQETYKVNSIDLKLLVNANAVVRKQHTEIEVKAVDDVEISTHRVVTVLNKSGEKFINAYENFDKGLIIKEQKAVILDFNGKEIRKFKQRDFSVSSNFQDFILFSDNKVSYLDYTPQKYPYTVIYTSRIRTRNSVFLPDWWPQEGYKVSIENSSYRLLNDAQIPLRFTERNLETLDYSSNNSEFDLDYSATNIAADTFEPLGPSFRSKSAQVIVALDKFSLEGIDGESRDWKEFGKWQYQNLVAGQGVLSDVIVSKVEELTKGVSSKEEKARIIYKYVQDNTRYIAVMLGIGGWKPYSAMEVDRLGYGDCKGLTNYTKALLASQGIESDYTVIYGGTKRNIDPEFTKMQGNHVILSIPRENDEDIWLECTSQDIPFGYLGDFTDDRYAVKIKPEGGEIVRTRKYTTGENLQKVRVDIELNSGGGFNAQFQRKSYGVPYGDIYLLENQPEDRRKSFYQENWAHFQSLNFESIDFQNDKKNVEFIENLSFNADNFCSTAGERLLMPLNFINGFDLKVAKDKERKTEIIIKRGRTFQENFNYSLPVGYEVEALPESKLIKTEFGSISLEVSVVNKNEIQQIVVQRNVQLLEGVWPPEKFKKFRNFISQVHQITNQRAVIVPVNKA
ncbi:DUF3857 domain-containing protein [Christiangramia sabulilitoris]|uniref:DUF3857 domain-containing protein n=1 Tax=Christiangramia sabulilitoris TaxID=2583991 RepID=A0A550HZC4_9FLAO|nr:DUF3857 domain-containing protein [Christiangramia sabulilitoris]TRO64077.1 DUF3857 domain-containing protein [Christiangramia sabulilitoris]